MSEPICISPDEMRLAPNQMAAMLDAFRMNMTEGNMNAMSWPARSEVAVRSSLPALNRAFSWGSRTNARTTRRPVICSRRISLTRSMRTCITP